MAYVDTSVLVACYCPEPLSRAAEAAVARSDGPALSRLVEIEFYSAVAVKVRMRELDRSTANRIVSLFRQHLDDGRYAAVSITDREYTLARDWIVRFSAPLRAPDALHLAAAFSNDLVLLTADRDLARAAAQFGVKHKFIR
jgi:hypothetical protein